jgi:anti-anti-sigma regulatory factor
MVDVIDGLTLRYELRAGTTTVTVEGSLDAHDRGILREGLDLARMLRPSGPIVIDLDRVDRLPLVALVILRQAGDDARRHGRKVSPRNLHHETIVDPGRVRILAAAPVAAGSSTPAGRSACRFRRPRRSSIRSVADGVAAG